MIARLIGIGRCARNVRLLAPLCALLSFALLALVLAAQAGLALCGNRIALDIPMTGDMPGMTMVALPNVSADHQLLICPVVLVLIVASTVLAAAAIVILWLDPDRAFTQRSFAREVSRMSLIRTAAALSACAAVAIGILIALNGSGLPSPATCAGLLILMICGALAAVGASMLCARVVLALGRRLLLAIAGAIADRRDREQLFRRRSIARHIAGASSRLFTARCGLRAPPSLLR